MGLLGGLFSKFKQGLKRTQELVLAPLGRLLGLRRLDAAQLEELEDLLLQADLGVTAVEQLMARLRRELKSGTEIDAKAMSAKFIRAPELAEVPYPVKMEPNLVVEYYSS